MNQVFADTSFYIALLRTDDDNHQRALQFDLTYTGSYLTSDFVLIELGNWLADVRNRKVFIELERRLRLNPRTVILAANPHWVARGHLLYAERLDKAWSHTDCISFQMMREHNITDALTADHHFHQAGFNALLMAEHDQR